MEFKGCILVSVKWTRFIQARCVAGVYTGTETNLTRLGFARPCLLWLTAETLMFLYEGEGPRNAIWDFTRLSGIVCLMFIKW